MMNIILLISCLLTQYSWASPETVPYVDLERYMGKWYEIATIEQRFQKGCRCTEAEYSLQPKGYVRVENSCIKNEKIKSAVGRAYIADEKTQAKLKVGFFLPWLPWFRGDYWIIGLDTDYRYAVISNSDASSLWILSRTRELEPALLTEAFRIAGLQGVDLSKVKISDQSKCELLEQH